MLLYSKMPYGHLLGIIFLSMLAVLHRRQWLKYREVKKGAA